MHQITVIFIKKTFYSLLQQYKIGSKKNLLLCTVVKIGFKKFLLLCTVVKVGFKKFLSLCTVVKVRFKKNYRYSYIFI